MMFGYFSLDTLVAVGYTLDMAETKKLELTGTGEEIVAHALVRIESLLRTNNEVDFNEADTLAANLSEALLNANVPHSFVKSFRLAEFTRAATYIEREFVSV